MKKVVVTSILSAVMALGVHAQSALYPQHFDLSEVTLLDSPFKTAMEKNFETLLAYDYNRLLTPYVRQAGLNTGDYANWLSLHPSFPNWGSNDFNLDGHVGGHYLTALSLAYAACRDSEKKALLKERVDRMVSVMKDCQNVYNNDETGLRGFIGGQPMNDAWRALYAGDIALRGTGNCAVPWYCQHKILAGLRDAYIYAGNTDARDVFLKLCDWCILVTWRLSDDQMEAMLNTEHGGVNESLLDAYQLTGENKYLTAAKRFTHKQMLNGLQTLNTAFLDNKHANTQVPKYIGMERIGSEEIKVNSEQFASAYIKAAENFWTDVAQNRTVCIGGNSMYEHFLAAGNSAQYINHLDGPESCNTNNMLKLSEMAFDRTHDSKYVDFYEYGMWNHILSTQDPSTGGYVYFTTLRPQGYRIYSTVNESMWCCVGTGMENHSKYGHFIYTHEGNSKLYVNLFTASELDNTDFKLKQKTDFPFSNTSQITVQKDGTYTIAIRHPAWTTDGFSIAVNGTVQDGLSVQAGTASYVELNRTWSVDDVITVTLPMTLRYTPCPNYTDYIAFQYGPILLAAQTTARTSEEAASTGLAFEALQNEYGHEGRMDHAPGSRATSKSLTSAPLLIGDRDGENGVLSKISSLDLEKLTFSLDASRPGVDGYVWNSLTLQPFYQIHHARYSCYWYQQTAENFANSSMGAEEAVKEAIANRTLDFVATGEQQSEAGHYTSYDNSTTGNYNNEYYRDARPDDGFIQYTLSYEGTAIGSGLSVLCRFTQADAGRKATLYVDGTPIANITALSDFNGMVTDGFYNVEYPIPASLMLDAQDHVKQSFVVRLAADKGTNAPGLYYLRLMKDYDAQLPATVTTSSGDTRSVVDGVASCDNGQCEMSHGFDYLGGNVVNRNHGISHDKCWRNNLGGEYYGYDLRTNGQTEGISLVVEYWGADTDRLTGISIDGITIATQEINAMSSGSVTMEYPIPATLLQGRQTIHVQFTSAANHYTPGTYSVYLVSGRTAVSRTRTNYIFNPENFEKNGTDGTITSVTYNDGAIQIASDGGDYSLNMRMKYDVKDTYTILSNQYLLAVKGQNLDTKAYLWWLMGCNHGAQDAPTYTYQDGSDVYLIWDLRRVATFNESEKFSRFFGIGEIPVTTGNGGAYSLLCMGLTSSSADHSATITDISFYSPEQLVDRYTVLRSTVSSLATSLTTSSTFAYDGYVYEVTGADMVDVKASLSQGDIANAPQSIFGYEVMRGQDDAVEHNRQLMLNAQGDATSLIQNADCNATAGWTGSGSVSQWQGQNWRGTSDANDRYLDVGALTYVQQTLSNMPAGYYKMVAAVRSEGSTTITPWLNETAGVAQTALTYGGAGVSMINSQGVQMPANQQFDGYGPEATRGWRWATVTTCLSAPGDLTLKYTLTGNGWKCVDDVHLYYSETADGFYTITDQDHDVPAGKVLTCDIVLDNPNTIVTSPSAVHTASGDLLSNNLVNGNISQMVLFDGYAFAQPASDYTATQATFHRVIPAGVWCTLTLPFVAQTEATYMAPESLDGTTLHFANAQLANDSPVIVRSESALTAITGSRQVSASGTLTYGYGIPMQGTYTPVDAVDYGNYVLGTDNRLYLVDSPVTLAPFRAFFKPASQATARVLQLDFDESATVGISGCPSVRPSVGKVYDLKGRCVDGRTLQKGVYIIEGRKRIVR